MDATDWSGGRALVTGASNGIGKEIARQLLAVGLVVYVGARDARRGQDTVRELGAGARLLELDVTDGSSIAVAATAVDRLETNVFGVVAVTNAFSPVMRGSARPRIVNVSSGTGSLGWSTAPNPQFPFKTGGRAAAYRSSKSALNALTVFYAQALDDEGFKVNALAPGLRATNLNARAANAGGDPAEAASGAVRLALLPQDGPTGSFYSWDGSVVAW